MRSLSRLGIALALMFTSVLSFAATHSLTASPAAVSFGTQNVNTTVSQPVAITNSGTRSLQVQSLAITGSTVFQASGLSSPVTLQPNQTLTVSVSFTPTASVSYSGTLTVTASAGTNKTVALSGTGTGGTSVAISISPSSATVQVNATQQFTATVTGTTDNRVTWLVGGVAGGNSTVGTISSTGLYTAPGQVPSSGGATVTAQSVADPTQSANATVSVTATTSYSKIDDSTLLDSGSKTGWGWCGTSSCAGGTGTTTQKISWGVQPSLDGGAAQFMASGSAFDDGLWWYKVGANDALANFRFDFWLNVSQAAASYSQALEFDLFQYIVPTRYMFGTQCDYGHGYNNGLWDVWNASGGSWHQTSFPCPGFVPGDWYHITWTFNRSSDLYEHYNTVAIDHYDSAGATLLDSSTTNINIALPSGPLPSGWSDNLGINFQLDINGVPGTSGTASYTTNVDKVTLTGW